jgi:GPN-loop GTPase
VDVRDWIDLKDVMHSQGLGPNGAQVAASDLLAVNARKIRDAIEGFNTQYVLVDTPGQIELFVFRQSGRYLTQFLYPESSLVAFLLDPFIAKSPSGFVSELLLASSVQFRLNQPTSHLLTKADMLTDEEIERIRVWSQEPDALQDAFVAEEEGLYREMSLDLLRVIDGLGNLPQLHVTSAVNLAGLEDLYAHIQQVVAGGEDILSD